jgi:subtilisin family serine protease
MVLDKPEPNQVLGIKGSGGKLNQETFSRLFRTAQEAGSVPVIADLYSPSTSAFTERDGAARQRDIAEAQRDILTSLSGGAISNIKQFQSVLQISLNVDAAGLMALRENPLVRQIWLDTPHPVSLLEAVPLARGNMAWVAGYTGLGQTVAILDTGVDKAHPFLAGKVVSEACYSSNSAPGAGSVGGSASLCPGGISSSTSDGSGVNCAASYRGCEHGTHVAGIAAGKGPGGSENNGMAKDANIIAIQVYSGFTAADCGGGSPCVMAWDSDIIAGLDRVYALRATYKIASVNISLEGGEYTTFCDDAAGALKHSMDNLRAAGVATVISAGNGHQFNAISSPGCVSSAVSVGSVCDNAIPGACATGVDGVASYSNVAGFMSLLAPGSAITSSVPGGLYASGSGTSFAAPMVTGAWALMKQAVPAMTVSQGLSALRATGEEVKDARVGGVVTGMRRINVNDAILNLKGDGASREK